MKRVDMVSVERCSDKQVLYEKNVCTKKKTRKG